MMRRKLWSILVLGLPYSFTVLLPVLSLLFLGSIVTNTYQDRIIDEKQKSIEVALDRFSQRIHNVDNLSYLIMENSVIKRYSYGTLRGEQHSVVDHLEVSKQLTSLISNSDIETAYLYDQPGGKIITPVSAYNKASDFFLYAYVVENLSPQESETRLKTVLWGSEISSAIKVRVFSKETEVIECRAVLPHGGTPDNQLQIILVMEIKDILSDLFGVLEAGDVFYLYDSGDRLIYTNGDQDEQSIQMPGSTERNGERDSKQELYKMLCTSEDKAWQLSVYTPNLLHRETGDKTIQTSWLLIGVSLVTSIVCCAYFTFRNHRELQDTVDLFTGKKRDIQKQKEKQNIHGYKVIKGYAEKIINENNSLKESIPRLESAHRYEVLDKLLRNTYVNSEEKMTFERELDFFVGKCVVICIRCKASASREYLLEDNRVKEVIKSQLEEILDDPFEVFDTSSRETICVLAVENIFRNDIAEGIASSLNDLAYQHKIEIEIGVGNVVDSIYQINESYLQAKAVLRYRETSGKKVYLYAKLVQMDDVYFYPKEFDEKIYNYVVSGKNVDAKGLIQKIYRENFEENEKILTLDAAETIKGRLKDLLILLAGKCQVPVDDILPKNSGEQSTTSFFKAVFEAVDMLTESIADNKQDVQKSTALKIKHYIDDNYCDNRLSIKQISLTLGLHESYISNVFRREYGEPVSVVIENKRIEKACKLIKNTDMKIGDIAQETGYSSDISFRRAFKKKMGMSPGEYRQQVKTEFV